MSWLNGVIMYSEGIMRGFPILSFGMKGGDMYQGSQPPYPAHDRKRRVTCIHKVRPSLEGKVARRKSHSGRRPLISPLTQHAAARIIATTFAPRYSLLSSGRCSFISVRNPDGVATSRNLSSNTGIDPMNRRLSCNLHSIFQGE